MSVVQGKERVPRCPSRLASEIGPYTPSRKQQSDEFLKYVRERERMKERWESMKSVGKEEKCVRERAETTV